MAKPGERVHAGQIVLTIETDKAEYEVEAPVDGRLAAKARGDGLDPEDFSAHLHGLEPRCFRDPRRYAGR